ncbi:MAG: TIGR02391 family protein [Deltaproteobacteria bacterium HGW-Deltaproteobacteria-12]|nr:MAG: TIGR02391 family protein [Deltaproteobacteria bacterium HGW-Deltaproteobacteria-12]
MLIGLAPEELAFNLLQVAVTNLQNGKVHRDVVISIEPPLGQERPYNRQKESQVEIALIEALQWLEINAILLPEPGINGKNGFRILGRRGNEMVNRDRFDTFQRAAAFPKTLLHPSIADRVWISLARGELADAVFIAFRTVEEAVRAAGAFENTDIGVDLMRKAFQADNGPLTDNKQPKPEREALAHLFAGAIGSYKNPHSHRTVTITDHTEAQEMVMLASHLLRIVDSRNQK